MRLNMTQIQVAAYPAGGGVFWIECSLCGPVFLVDGPQITPESIAHLNKHGCQIVIDPNLPET
jgi:hypothetical protein